MSGPSTDASAWLLDRFDNGDAKRGTHVRQIIQLIPDVPPDSTEDAPSFTGAALWPRPALHADLDEIERRERNTGPATVRGMDGRRRG